MNDFIGRERELQQLENVYLQEGFQMTVLYGRRRIGKTTLLNKFCEKKESIFFTAVETGEESNLEQFGATVYRYFNRDDTNLHFHNFEEVFEYISEKMRNDAQNDKKLIIVIDEYPYLAQTAKGISSQLQKIIDTQWSAQNIYLILCGSSISFMEDEVLSSKSPLYGRRTSQMDLQPFDYQTSALFTPGYSPVEKSMVYGVTGGIAKYLSMFDEKRSFDENMVRLYFQDDGYFFEEPKNLLRQEFRNIALYSSIIEALASGAVQMNEISAKVKMDTAAVSQALTKLIAVRIVKKDVPILNEKNRRLAQYTIVDGMFGFWYRFIPKAMNAVVRGFGAIYYEQVVKPEMNHYMGTVFESICREHTFRCGITGQYETLITDVGKWRGNDNQKKEPADIDVVGINPSERKAVIGECKFRNEKFGIKEAEKLIDRSRLIVPYMTLRYLLFSKSGFTQEVIDKYKNANVEFITLDDIYQQSALL